MLISDLQLDEVSAIPLELAVIPPVPKRQRARIYVEGMSGETRSSRTVEIGDVRGRSRKSRRLTPRVAFECAPIVEIVTATTVGGSMSCSNETLKPDCGEPVVVTGSVSAASSLADSDARNLFSFSDLGSLDTTSLSSLNPMPVLFETITLSDHTELTFQTLATRTPAST